MIMGNNESHLMSVQVNILDSWVCGPDSTGVLCSHECTTVRLCDEFARPNMVSEPKVVPGMMWLTCEGSVGNTSHVRQDLTLIN